MKDHCNNVIYSECSTLTYVGIIGFESRGFAVSGRGERKIEFRSLPMNCTIRIYNISEAYVI
ncbi:MAG: hypothetical protein P8Z35_00675 [Ignavibacteriaceae bacterium]